MGTEKPEENLESACFGSRLSLTRGEWDLAGYVYSGLDPKPTPVVDMTFYDDDYLYEGTVYHLTGYSAE